jgi:hypothetical protein
VDVATDFCFRDFQEIAESPIRKTYPEKDFLVSIHDANDASENPSRDGVEALG